jgi:hypothetical protein
VRADSGDARKKRGGNRPREGVLGSLMAVQYFKEGRKIVIVHGFGRRTVSSAGELPRSRGRRSAPVGLRGKGRRGQQERATAAGKARATRGKGSRG